MGSSLASLPTQPLHDIPWAVEYSRRVGRARNEVKRRKIHKSRRFWILWTLEYSQRVGRVRSEAERRKIHKSRGLWPVRTWQEEDSQKSWISSWRDLGAKTSPWHRGLGILGAKFPFHSHQFSSRNSFGLSWLNPNLENSGSLGMALLRDGLELGKTNLEC